MEIDYSFCFDEFGRWCHEAPGCWKKDCSLFFFKKKKILARPETGFSPGFSRVQHLFSLTVMPSLWKCKNTIC